MIVVGVARNDAVLASIPDYLWRRVVSMTTGMPRRDRRASHRRL
jgi:hypothetical protein